MGRSCRTGELLASEGEITARCLVLGLRWGFSLPLILDLLCRGAQLFFGESL